MKTKLKYLILYLAHATFISCQEPNEKTGLIKNLTEFDQAVSEAEPGDIITLASGVWQDTELLFEANGTPDQPITLTVEEKGKVTLEGASNLRIAGEHLIVSGLIFRNGYTPTNEVISFKKDKNTLAHHTRVTECVIDNFNNPERFETDTWVAIYGKNNRFDHNHLSDKRNHGVTLAVRLNSEESQQNNHRIDHNYFGPRQNLGANGGETLRVGTSHFSMSNSNTLVEYNYFDRCNGEHEIISNKSCQNTYQSNTFFECRGTLTMRHGNETKVDGNFFLGNGKVNTGGVRIINETQTVTNNYFYGLTGYRFRGALVIMNGVPNSPLNRYFQVKDSEASNNTFINCDHVQFCAGSDEERSATPVNSVVKGNVFYHEDRANLFTVYDDISGIQFQDNILSTGLSGLSESGFSSQSMELAKNESGLMFPKDLDSSQGTKYHELPATKENTGVTWYPKKDLSLSFNTGEVISVPPGTNTLYEAVEDSKPGDILELAAGANYHLSKFLTINHPLTLKSAEGPGLPLVTFEKTSLFYIENGGALSLVDINIDGAASPDGPGNAVISTSRYSMNRNYKLLVEGCAFTNLDINHTFDVLKVYKNTFADSIWISNSIFRNISGSVLQLNKEIDDIGIYNAEFVTIENCVFDNVAGVALNLHRGGKDESTFGPILNMDHNVFHKVGHGKRNKSQAAIELYGVQVAHISNSIFEHSSDIKLHLVVGEPITKIHHNNFYQSGKILANEEPFESFENTYLKVNYVDTVHFKLMEGSPMTTAGSDRSSLGILPR